MTYLSWATIYEGAADQVYFDVLIPRLMEEIVMSRGTRNSAIPNTPAVRISQREVEKAAQEACAARQAFHLIFIHADTGGRNIATTLGARSNAYCVAMHRICSWPHRRCISISPRHETEAWILADPIAVTTALGFRGLPESIGLPATANEAERLANPKEVLAAAVGRVRGRRGPIDVEQIFPAIAQRQSADKLRQAASFRNI